MYLLTIDLKRFSAAHRLVKGYQGKCNHLHGHNYTLKVVLYAEALGEDGLVVDFAVIRQLCDGWVQGHLDHCTLVYAEDLPLLEFVRVHKQKHYVMDNNTTVEYLACEIYQQLSRGIAEESARHEVGFRLKEVQLWESDDCSAVYRS